MFKQLIKKLAPTFIISSYHYCLAFFGALIYGFPSEKMIVIGVTGTKGKSSTCNLIWQVLSEVGHKTGMTTTANFRIGDKEWINDKKQTMLGRFQLQKMLSDMVKAGCKYAIVETSSEGIKQFRHRFINYDITVFTNLSPEHIEAHGTFEKYKIAKGNLFEQLAREKKKNFNGKTIDKIIIVNLDDRNYKYFSDFKADKKFGYGISNEADLFETIRATDIELTPKGSRYAIRDTRYAIQLLGEFNIYNCLAAITVALSQGIDLQTCAQALKKVKGIPGRMEIINQGQPFTVVVDYAHEPKSLEWVYQTLQQILSGKLIAVLGSCGGGRDKSRRPIMGGLAAKYCDYAIFTNEDPYDEDPMEIINQVAQGAQEYLKTTEKVFKFEKILDRKEAIKKAFSIAQPGDCVILTGKGSEQAIMSANGEKIPWDERKVARELLR